MILFTNGCSWTWGGGLDSCEDNKLDDQERLKLVWPHHLSNLLNVNKTVNLAAGCGSNSRILRTTFDWIHEQNIEDLKDTVAVIQWSEYSRYEYYTPEDYDEPYENISDRWARAKIGCVISQYEYITDQLLNQVEKRLETLTDVESMYKHVTECDALGSLFKNYGIKYYYWNFGNRVHRYPNKVKDYMLSNHRWLDNGICDWEYDRIRINLDPHPNLIGHKQLAEIIYNRMKEKE
jgi:hypothetical protein